MLIWAFHNIMRSPTIETGTKAHKVVPPNIEETTKNDTRRF